MKTDYAHTLHGRLHAPFSCIGQPDTHIRLRNLADGSECTIANVSDPRPGYGDRDREAASAGGAYGVGYTPNK